MASLGWISWQLASGWSQGSCGLLPDSQSQIYPSHPKPTRRPEFATRRQVKLLRKERQASLRFDCESYDTPALGSLPFYGFHLVHTALSKALLVCCLFSSCLSAADMNTGGRWDGPGCFFTRSRTDLRGHMLSSL